MSIDHYENFPVASVLLPYRMRQAVVAIYRFARQADDYADEGDADQATRLCQLEQCHSELLIVERVSKLMLLNNNEASIYLQHEKFVHDYVPSLCKAVAEYKIPMSYLFDLLVAFKQDINKVRYDTWADLISYCYYSANPIGRLMLTLINYDKSILMDWSLACEYSDAICTGLQLVNFWQDIAVDWKKGRIYIPKSELLSYGLDETAIALECNDHAWKNLLSKLCEDAAQRLLFGVPLVSALPRRFAWEIQLTIEGGLRVLEQIVALDYDVFHQRPRLKYADWFRMLWRTCQRRMKFGKPRYYLERDNCI